MPVKPVFLVVEDDEDDRDFLMMACQEGAYFCDLVFAHDGTHALDLLEHHIPTPSLIILDINMPKMNGMQLLEKLKESSQWKHLPIIMLTTSQDLQMIQDAYQLGANSYLVKPYSYQKVSELFDGLYSYWIRTVQLPKK